MHAYIYVCMHFHFSLSRSLSLSLYMYVYKYIYIYIYVYILLYTCIEPFPGAPNRPNAGPAYIHTLGPKVGIVCILGALGFGFGGLGRHPNFKEADGLFWMAFVVQYLTAAMKRTPMKLQHPQIQSPICLGFQWQSSGWPKRSELLGTLSSEQ